MPTHEWDQSAKLLQRLELAMRRGWRAASDSLLTDLEYSLRRLRTECDACHANLPRSVAANRLAPPGEIVADILVLDADFDGLAINLEEKLLQVRTYPIVLGDTALGRFRIELRWELIGRERSYEVIAETPNTPENDEGVTHPHVREAHRIAKEKADTALRRYPSHLEEAFRSANLPLDSDSRHPRYSVGNKFFQIEIDEHRRMARLSNHEGRLSAVTLDAIRSATVEARDRLRAQCAFDELPYYRTVNGIRYFTFAGYLVNKAIGLFAQKPGFRADDLSLQVPSPIEWSELPTDPGAFESVFHLLFEQTSEQSIYQAQLPSALQLREYLQEWLHDETVQHVLNRLVHSKPVEVDAQVLQPFVEPAD